VETTQDIAAAKNYALRLIKFRLRSEKELRDKLQKKEVSPEVIDSVAAFLKKAKLLDDVLFARLWVESRIKRSIGLNRLAYELKQKGIDKSIAEEALRRVSENYNEKDAVFEIVRHKLEKMKNIPPEKIKARLYGFLLRRGFPKDIVIEALLREVGYEKACDE
jgi:regulatory protein